MTNPTLPNVPFPLPLLSTVAIQFKNWQKHVQTPPGEFVSTVSFKLVMLCHEEVIYSFGYLFSAEAGDVLTGHAFVEDEDYSFNPENGWQGGDSLGQASRRKMPVSASLKTVNGHPQIDFVFGGPQQYKYTASLTGVSGHDPEILSAMILTGDRTGFPPGKVLSSFGQDFIEKTHWPLAW